MITLLGLGTNDPGPENCCWQCPCESNVCCDDYSPASRAYSAVRRVFAKAKTNKALRGLGIDPVAWMATNANGPTAYTPPAATPFLYKFGMSPMLWGLAALAVGGAVLVYRRK